MQKLTAARVKSITERGLRGNDGTQHFAIDKGGSKSWVQRVTAALCRSPYASPETLASHGDDKTQRYFATECVRALKSRQVQIALVGAAIGVVLAFVLIAGLALVDMAGISP